MHGVDEGARRALFALCELAADIANAPGAAIVLAGEDGPSFVATLGPDIESLDCEALLNADLGSGLVPDVSDAAIDPESGDEGGAAQSDQTAGSARLYLSARLTLETPAGLRIGTLCILDEHPRSVPASAITLLKHVATAAVGILGAQLLQSDPRRLASRPDASVRNEVSADECDRAIATGRMSDKPSWREERTQLRRAIGNGEFVPFYQPNVELKWGRIVGFEVLARWQHPTRGLLSPEAFRPAISDRSITPLLTRAILNAALKDSASWRADGLSPGSLAINVCSGDLMSKTFATELMKTLDRYGFAPGDLVIEVTEGIAMGEPEGQVHKTLSTLRGEGARVVLDDFGTGFAGLQHLRNWPIDGLKLDRDFVRNCLTNKEDQIIIRNIVQMCRDLELDVVAEGIEDNAQYLFLANIGCAFGQGFYCGRPAPASDVPALLRGASECAANNAAKTVTNPII